MKITANKAFNSLTFLIIYLTVKRALICVFKLENMVIYSFV